MHSVKGWRIWRCNLSAMAQDGSEARLQPGCNEEHRLKPRLLMAEIQPIGHLT